MSSVDPHILAAFDAAQKPIRQATAAAIEDSLGTMKLAGSTTARERGLLVQAHSHLLQSREPLLAAFDKALREHVGEELAPETTDAGFRDPTDWMEVGLVGDDQIEERLAFERVGQFISHECEGELRELAAYAGEMLRLGGADPSRNPLRGDIIGAALSEAIETISTDSETRRTLVKELGRTVAKALPPFYRAIIDDFKARGLRQADLTVRQTPSGAGGGGGGTGSAGGGGGGTGMGAGAGMGIGGAGGDAAAAPGMEAMRELWEKSMMGRMPMGNPGAGGGAGYAGGGNNFQGSLGGEFQPVRQRIEDAARLLDNLMRSAPSGGAPQGGSTQWGDTGITGPGRLPSGSSGPAPSEADLMRLLRRLNGGGPSGPDDGSAAAPPTASRDTGWALGANFVAGDRTVQTTSGGAIATNLIRAHQEELVQASPGQLDHMVIEVVAGLFDQILADPRVPPQIAREIGRLQLPVLRVALRDATFFSSRKHPVRRFINRISTLASNFDELESGPGKELLGRINALVTDIVEGDFDQISLYEHKVFELESFAAELARKEAESSPAAHTLLEKEAQWLRAQRFGGQLQEALEPLAVAPYLKEFLARIWGQVIVAAAQDADPEKEKRFRRAASDLVASVQPKRSVEHRAQFLATLPKLTAALNDGLALIEWPKAEHDAFFSKLMADHTGSLKAVAGTDLDHNMLLRRIATAAWIPLPSKADTAAGAATAPAATEGYEPRFSAEEARGVGLLDDTAVDWPKAPSAPAQSPVEVDFDLATRPAPLDAAPPDAADRDALPTIAAPEELTAPPRPSGPSGPEADPAEPTEGPQLRNHLQIGGSYQLQLKDQWEKVRLTYMSPGRTVFLFAYGSKDRRTITMTARMLQRLCETHRMKTFEASPLVDRATERLRMQLAPGQTT